MEMISLAVETAKFFEKRLERLGATGKGLHEKTKSIEGRLKPDLSRRLRRIAAQRNKQVHEPGAKLDEIEFLIDALSLAVQLGASGLEEKIDNTKPAGRFFGRHLTSGENVSSFAASQSEQPESELKERLESADIEGETEINKPVRRSLGSPLTSGEIVSLLTASQSELTGSELKELCDIAFSEASAAPYKLHAATNAFIYLAKRPDVDLDYRFEKLALALIANGNKFEIPALARQLLPMEYLESRWLKLQKSDGASHAHMLQGDACADFPENQGS